MPLIRTALAAILGLLALFSTTVALSEARTGGTLVVATTNDTPTSISRSTSAARSTTP